MDLSHVSLPTPPSHDDSSSSAVARGRRGCGAGGSRLSMMSGSEVLVTSSVEDNDATDNILTDIIVSSLRCVRSE